MATMKKSMFSACIYTVGMFALGAGPASASETSGSDTQTPYQQAVAAARAEQQKARVVDGEWRDIDAILKQADKAAKNSDYAKATELANTAAFQGRMGREQAEAQQHHGEGDGVPRLRQHLFFFSELEEKVLAQPGQCRAEQSGQGAE